MNTKLPSIISKNLKLAAFSRLLSKRHALWWGPPHSQCKSWRILDNQWTKLDEGRHQSMYSLPSFQFNSTPSHHGWPTVAMNHSRNPIHTYRTSFCRTNQDKTEKEHVCCNFCMLLYQSSSYRDSHRSNKNCMHSRAEAVHADEEHLKDCSRTMVQTLLVLEMISWNYKPSLNAKKTDDSIFNYVSQLGMDWVTIHPRSPHFGGLWEAAVNRMKHQLRRVVGT